MSWGWKTVVAAGVAALLSLSGQARAASALPPGPHRLSWWQCAAAWATRSGPSPAWLESGRIRRTEGGRAFLEAPYEGELKSLEVARWSPEGNPVVWVPFGSLRFLPTQGSLPNRFRYRGRTAPMSQVTWREPILAEWQIGEPGPGPQSVVPGLVVFDGHHRYAHSLAQKSGVYVEVIVVSERTDLKPVARSWDLGWGADEESDPLLLFGRDLRDL